MALFEFSIRFPRLFVAGKQTIIVTRLRLLEPVQVSGVEVAIRCHGLRTGKQRWRDSLTAEDGWVERTVEISPGRAGVWQIEVVISALVAGTSRAIVMQGEVHPWGQAGMTILDGRDLKTLIVNIEKKAFFGAMLGDLHLPDLKTVNDLLSKEIPDEWRTVRLHSSNGRQNGGEGLRGLHSPHSTAWPTRLGKWKRPPGVDVLFMDMPVTQGMWELVTGQNFRDFLLEAAPEIVQRMNGFFQASVPVFGITLEEAEAFCEQFECYCVGEGLLEPHWHFRLPARHEWRTVCGRLPENLSQHCFNLALPGFRRHDRGPIGADEMRRLLKPNAAGLYSMIGNVSEWCREDGAGDRLVHGVLLGGSWHERDVPERKYCEYREPATLRSSRAGFRVIAELRAE